MVAVPANGNASLIELGAVKLGQLRAARRARRGERGSIFAAIGEVAGTVVALACLTLAAFIGVNVAVGLVVAGIAVLLLDFKVAVVRRTRAAQRPGVRRA
jgi:Flp pilus assembly protein TadB